MPAKAVIRNGICYMCTASCPSKIHVSNGKAIKIDMADTGSAECQFFDNLSEREREAQLT